jgi:ADP-ribose pyrophosphatase
MRIVIADNLVRSTLSPERQFSGIPSNVGAREVARLMGRGREYGDGPIPRLLRGIASDSGGTGLILLREEAPGGPDGDGPGDTLAEWVEPVAPVAESVPVVSCPPGRIAWRELIEAIAGVAGVPQADVESGTADLDLLVVGCHTDTRVLAISTYLCSVLGFERVAVCPHLVGSATSEAHYAALRHNLPMTGVQVLLDLAEAARWVGLDPEAAGLDEGRSCEIGPPDEYDRMSEEARRIVQLVCMHWSRAHLRPLSGGFSGSYLYVAKGWKGDAATEPMVVKIDNFSQMRRELDGYHQVKDFFGKHVPTFGYPVREGEMLGVGMELAAMKGAPRTLQEDFEDADSEAGLERFRGRLEKALDLLAEKLYGNTLGRTGVSPYRAFGLQAEQQLVWLRQNGELILDYIEETGARADPVDLDQLVNVVRVIARNPDSLESEVCLQHGDLNFANVICDEGDNVWFIDWTHAGQHPLELDFAKLENDVKFVMSKDFDPEDLPRLRALEEYLLTHQRPDPYALPDTIKFAKWDLRFRKIVDAVRLIRDCAFSLKADPDEWVVYRVALLRYAMHTLSFDARRGRGECDATQLMYALYSCDAIALDLVQDDFNLRIRAERPPSYPPRQRISIDESPWVLDCEEYDPPYFVAPSVLAAGRDVDPAGWADPEDPDEELLAQRPARFRDDRGRPLNPRGRTGIAGRGLLGLWGANASVMAVVLRTSEVTGDLEVLLGTREEGARVELPQGFLLLDEDPQEGLARVLRTDTGWEPDAPADLVSEGYAYDARQTDHAWVEVRAFVVDAEEGGAPDVLEPGGDFDELSWWPLDGSTMTRMLAGQAAATQAALDHARAEGWLDEETFERLASRAG